MTDEPFFFWGGTEQISGMSEAMIDSMMGALQRLKDVRHFVPTLLRCLD